VFNWVVFVVVEFAPGEISIHLLPVALFGKLIQAFWLLVFV